MSEQQFSIDNKPFDYINEDVIKPPSYTLRRFNSLSGGKHRYYYEMIGSTPVLYSSLTTLIDNGYADSSKGLEEWRAQMRAKGIDPEAYTRVRADYGTIMHVIYGEYLSGVKIPMLPHMLATFIRSLDINMPTKRLEFILTTEIEELVRDMLAFAQWVQDFNIRPLAVELMLRDPKLMVGTPIDLIALADVPVKGFHGEVYKSGPRKGDPKETTVRMESVIEVDFKSGRKGFYPKHALQLEIGKRIFLTNYPDQKIDFMYNFSPKDWKTEPSYNFTEQSNNSVLDEIDEILSVGKKRFLKKKKSLKIYKGALSIKEEFNAENHLTITSVEDLLTEQHKAENGSRTT